MIPLYVPPVNNSDSDLSQGKRVNGYTSMGSNSVVFLFLTPFPLVIKKNYFSKSKFFPSNLDPISNVLLCLLSKQDVTEVVSLAETAIKHGGVLIDVWA